MGRARHSDNRGDHPLGQTWPHIREIDDGPSAYSALGLLADGRFGVVWESGDLLPYEKIRFAAFNRAWVLAEQP